MLQRLLILLLLVAAERTVLAAASPPSPEEEQAFKAASESFRLTYYERAEKDFADFVQKFPASTHLPEAGLLQAEARLRQSNYAGAIALLTTNLATAGTWADKYLFCLGQAQIGLKAFDKAGEAFGRLAREFPASTNRFEASYLEALMKARLGAWVDVIHLLQDTNSVFQTVGAKSKSEPAFFPLFFQGYLLLSEAELAQKDYPSALAALEPFKQSLLNSTNKWQRQHLICRIHLAAGHLEEALQSATNLVVMAAETKSVPMQAESFAFAADVLERLGRLDKAIEAYTNNLVEGAPANRQREALYKTTELSIAQNRISEAAQTLERFLMQNPKTSAADLAWLSLGELRLRQYFESSGAAKKQSDLPGPGADTNILNKAKAALLTVTTNFAQSPVLGKCQMDLGWCYFFEGNPAESEKQFSAALEKLPRSTDRAISHFKLGDLQFKRGHPAGALTNYNAVVEEAGPDRLIETNLFELALYQTVRAALAATNSTAATNALAKLRQWYPNSFHTDGAVLLTGQSISRDNPAEAGTLYADFLKQSPSAVLRPELELAIARTFEMRNAWTNAIEQYDLWLKQFTNHDARPRAEYFRAYALAQTGDQTNAFNAFTNFVTRFPGNELAPMAQWWVAEFYFQQGAYAAAESSFQSIATNRPNSEMAFRARLWAGRAAVGRTSYDNASQFYFYPLWTNAACPMDIRFQGLFEDANATMSRDSTNKAADYNEAIKAFRLISQSTNALRVLAWGQIANCYLQLAQLTQTPSELTNSLDYFQKIIDEPQADASARSIAKVGIAVVLKRQAQDAPAPIQLTLRKKALDHYLDVFNRNILRKEEVPDPFWTKKAGIEAAELAGTLDLWEVAARIYERLIDLLPQLRPQFIKAQEKAAAQAKLAQTKVP